MTVSNIFWRSPLHCKKVVCCDVRCERRGLWKTSVTCTAICSQIDRGIPFSVYPSSAPHPGRYAKLLPQNAEPQRCSWGTQKKKKKKKKKTSFSCRFYVQNHGKWIDIQLKKKKKKKRKVVIVERNDSTVMLMIIVPHTSNDVGFFIPSSLFSPSSSSSSSSSSFTPLSWSSVSLTSS